MKKLLALAMIVGICLPTISLAQNPVVTAPKNVATNNNASSTVIVTNTFQSIYAENNLRSSCTVVNYGSNTMWVYFGAIAGATKDKSIQLAVGQATYCVAGVIVLRDQVSITGTATEKFYATQQ